jgi:hypothetical protein
MGQFRSSLYVRGESFDLKGNPGVAKVFAHVSLDSPLASQQRETILRAIPFVDADPRMRNALLAFDDRLYRVDRGLSQEIVINIASFYVMYAQLLTQPTIPDARGNPDLRLLMDTRLKITKLLEELKLKAAHVNSEPAYNGIIDSVTACLFSCTSALWDKHRYRQAIEMYNPTGYYDYYL